MDDLANRSGQSRFTAVFRANQSNCLERCQIDSERFFDDAWNVHARSRVLLIELLPAINDCVYDKLMKKAKEN
ncbi:MAG: hypothetical protein MZU97_10465 [Bacillus subtilis]|nr:hypothetical protein [Bacillus subtilis]